MNTLEVVRLLLKNPMILVNDVNKADDTALMEASKEKHKVLVQLLLKHKNIDVNQQNWVTEKTALSYASHIPSNDEVISLLLRCPNTDIKLLDENFKTPLQISEEKCLNYNSLFNNRSNLIESGHTCCSAEMKRGLQIAAKDDNEESAKGLIYFPYTNAMDKLM